MMPKKARTKRNEKNRSSPPKGTPAREEIVNGCIRAYFMEVFGRCRGQADPNDMMLRVMEEAVS